MEPLVAVVVGSRSDDNEAYITTSLLTEMGIPWELSIISAHRNPEELEKYCAPLKRKGFKVVIALAGGSAALPGAIAAKTSLPVIGVALAGNGLDGKDALMSMIGMPPGIPIGVAGIGVAGAKNAAYLAARILLSDENLAMDRGFLTYSMLCKMRKEAQICYRSWKGETENGRESSNGD